VIFRAPDAALRPGNAIKQSREKKGPIAGARVHKVEDSRRRSSQKGGKTAAAHVSTEAAAHAYLK